MFPWDHVYGGRCPRGGEGRVAVACGGSGKRVGPHKKELPFLYECGGPLQFGSKSNKYPLFCKVICRIHQMDRHNYSYGIVVIKI